MVDFLGILEANQKSGLEEFQYNGKSINKNLNLNSFWKWAFSDLVSNATRGVLAEFIVAKALKIDLEKVRNEWDAYDLVSSQGIKIEVKSSSYIQSWAQKDFSKIIFSVEKKKLLNSETNQYSKISIRPSDVYVFAILKCKNQRMVDPLCLDQWEFFVLPTEVLNKRIGSQHSISLNSLKKLCGDSVTFFELRKRVTDEYHKQLTLIN